MLWKGKSILKFRKDLESKIIYKDRIVISHKHDLLHLNSVKVLRGKSSIIQYLNNPEQKAIFNKPKSLQTLQFYVEIITVQRFASEEFIELIKHKKLFTVMCFCTFVFIYIYI